jgi:hypothetical protein
LATTLLLCNTARIECLLWSNELSAAQQASISIANDYSELFDPVTATQISEKLTKYSKIGSGLEADHSIYQANLVKAEEISSGLREITISAHTKPLLFESLATQGIQGNRLLERLGSEKSEPLLLLRHE